MYSPSDSSNKHHDKHHDKHDKHHDKHDKHHDKHDKHHSGTEMYGSGNRDMPSYSTGNGDPNLYRTTANSGAEHHHQQGFVQQHPQGFVQQQPQGTGYNQQPGTGYGQQGAAGYNQGVMHTEYDNDRNKHHHGKDKHHDKNHEDESFASRMMGKVKHAVGADHPKEHHKNEHY